MYVSYLSFQFLRMQIVMVNYKEFKKTEKTRLHESATYEQTHKHTYRWS